MIDFKCRLFFSVSENGDNGLGDEGADGGNAPIMFWDRTAPLGTSFLWMERPRGG